MQMELHQLLILIFKKNKNNYIQGLKKIVYFRLSKIIGDKQLSPIKQHVSCFRGISRQVSDKLFNREIKRKIEKKENKSKKYGRLTINNYQNHKITRKKQKKIVSLFVYVNVCEYTSVFVFIYLFLFLRFQCRSNFPDLQNLVQSSQPR